jgi:hypothetical protein
MSIGERRYGFQVREGHYPQALGAIRDACACGGVDVTSRPVPRLKQLPTKLIQWCARGALRPIVASDPRMLRGESLAIYLYPADLLLRGKVEVIAAVRAALVRQPLDRHAWLVADPAAQRIEDEIGRMWALVERHRDTSEIGDSARDRVHQIARELDERHLPFDQWILLYANLHRLERAISGGPCLVDASAQRENGAIMEAKPRHPTESAPALVTQAINEARELARLEIALAKMEMRQELAAAKKAGITLGAGTVLAIAGITMLLVAISLAFSATWLPALLVGVIALAGAAIVGLVGYKAAPKEPLGETRKRATTEARMLKEHTA